MAADSAVRRTGTIDIRDVQHLYRARIDLIDPTSKTLLRSAVVQPLVLRFLTDSLAIGVRQDGKGNWLVDLWRVHLEEGSPNADRRQRRNG
jgi:hypothetical protein